MSDFSDTPGLVGLQNLGNTCYMNSALQALSNCQQLTRFVLNCPTFPRDKGLCRSYSELMREIWESGGSQYAVPTSIIRNIKCIYPAFRGCTQQDTQEFLRCFLEQLHDELKQSEKTNSRKQSITSDEGDQKEDSEDDHKDDSEDDTKEPEKIHRTIISDIFEFNISSSVVCSNCNSISTTKESFKDLSIPIPSRDHPYYQASVNEQPACEDSGSIKTPREDSDNLENTDTPSEGLSKIEDDNDSSGDDRKKDKAENQLELQRSFIASLSIARWIWDWISYFSNWFWGPQVSLQDCLSIFFGSDPLEGDNEYSCEKCTKRNRGIKYLKILDLPEVLCIHLKRYESVGSAKINTHVTFPLTGLDLSPFMSDDSEVKCPSYDLIACICHHGSALQTGHYTTYALNYHDEQWYEFDDQYVSNVPGNQVENSEAYILFYQKSSTQD